MPQAAATPMSRNRSETWGTLFHKSSIVKRFDYAAGGRIVITKMSVSLIRTGPASPDEYQRKLLQHHCSGEVTSPRTTGLRWMYRSFSIRFFSVHTLKS
jgi:hypothetical protein